MDLSLTKTSVSVTILTSCVGEFSARSLNRVSSTNWPENQFTHEPERQATERRDQP